MLRPTNSIVGVLQTRDGEHRRRHHGERRHRRDQHRHHAGVEAEQAEHQPAPAEAVLFGTAGELADVVQQVHQHGEEQEEQQRRQEGAERDAADVAVEQAHRRSALRSTGTPNSPSRIIGSQPNTGLRVATVACTPSMSPT
jgi:hypothetical protein